MEQKKIIQIWDYHKPIPVSDVTIRISCDRPGLPDDVEKRVEENWQKFKAKNSRAQDNKIAFLTDYGCVDDKFSADVFTAGFSYNQWLNRDDKEMIDACVVNEFDYNPLASWILALCDNGKYVLLGNKKDFGNKKISSFGGFTSQDDIEDGEINAEKYIRRILRNEAGDVADRIEEISMIGLNYYPIVGPKGFDGVYIVHFDGGAEELQELFEENSQFSKQLLVVENNPNSLMEYLEHEHWEPTRSCMGGMLNFIGAMHGEEALEDAINGYSKKDMIWMRDRPLVTPANLSWY